MNQPQQTTPVAETATPAAETPTLEQIAKDLSVTEQARDFTNTVQPVQQVPNYGPAANAPGYYPPSAPAMRPTIPDPVTDPEGYKAHVALQLQALNQLDSSLQQVTTKLQTWERTQTEQRIAKDVDFAVQKVNAKLNVDPTLAEALLEQSYKRNKNFKLIWDNRERNPAALEQALDRLTSDYAAMLSVKQDPQIARNLQAAKSSQQTMATTTRTANDDVPTDPAEFDRWWAQKSKGY
jgi:hypothetical protein